MKLPSENNPGKPPAKPEEVESWLCHRLAGELRDLVTAMLGYSELTLAVMEPDHATRPHVEKVLHYGCRAALLIRRLEALSLAAFLQEAREG